MVMQKEMSKSLKDAAEDAMFGALARGENSSCINGKFPSFSVSTDKNAPLGINMGKLSVTFEGVDIDFYVFQRLA